MDLCSKCGTELAEGAKFCPKCGTSVENYEVQLNEEYSDPSNNRLIKPFDIGDWLFLPVFILLLIAIIFIATLSSPNIHCKLFSWFPYFETPSVVAYKYISCAKEGDIDGMMGYAYMKDYPSITKMKKNIEELNKTPTATTPTRKDYIDSNNQLHMITEYATKKDYVNLFKRIHLVSGQNTEIQDFSIESEETNGSQASVTVLFKLRNGVEEKKSLKLKKDEEGVWGFYFNSGVKDALQTVLDKEKKMEEEKYKKQQEEFNKKFKQLYEKKKALDSHHEIQNSDNGMSESNKQKTLEYMSELQQIANEIDNIYNTYVGMVSSGNLDPMTHGNLEIKATQNMEKLRSQAESIWNKLIALARETGGDVRALQEEKKKYLGDAYRMQMSLHSVGMNTNY